MDGVDIDAVHRTRSCPGAVAEAVRALDRLLSSARSPISAEAHAVLDAAITGAAVSRERITAALVVTGDIGSGR